MDSTSSNASQASRATPQLHAPGDASPGDASPGDSSQDYSCAGNSSSGDSISDASTPGPSAALHSSSQTLPVSARTQVDATPRIRSGGERALVLGGGGSTGNAWLIGVLAGMAEAGLEVTGADVVIGTSAGATAAAQIAGATPAELLAQVLDAAPGPAPSAGAARPSPAGNVVNHLERTDRIIAAATDPADMRRRMGASALDLAADFDPSPRWRATVATRFHGHAWPDRYMLITAVDARTGEPVVFDRDSRVDLVDAVAASCASGFAYSAGADAFIDGGYRAGAENADLAAGYSRVLVLSPFGGRSRTPTEWGLGLAAQIGGLRAGGSQVETVFPDSTSEHMFGVNAMDASLRPAAARAGLVQGRDLAAKLRSFWL